MPYPQDRSQLDKLITQALQDTEIQQSAKQAGLNAAFLKSQIYEREAEIWRSAGSEIEEFNLVEANLQTANREYYSALPDRKRVRALGIVVWNVLIITLIIALIGYIIAGYQFGWGTPVSWLITPMGLIVVAGIAISMVVLVRYYLRLKSEYDQRFNEIYRAKSEQFGIPVLEERLKAASAAVDKALLEKGILAHLRETINAKLEPSYETALPQVSSKGLGELHNSDYEIPTDVQERVHHYIQTVTAGSIGIAGPRGAGKTTLLQSFCDRQVLETNQPQPLAVMTSAPVEYQGRDFILHLFASVCLRILELHGVPAPAEAWDHFEELYTSSRRKLKKSLLQLRRLLLASGVFFVGVSLILAGLTIASKTKAPVETPPAAPNERPSELILTPTSTPEPASEGPVLRYIQALDLKPGMLFTWGILLICIAYGLPLVLQMTFIDETVGRNITGEPKQSQPPIVQEALQRLKEIRFQQSYSSGWTGTLKFPIVFQGGANTAISLARNQLTLPEIVNHYRDFIKLAAPTYYSMIIIGIDELDKLDSDQQAHRFLNEIKAIFNLDRCFYLVSVSESAISSFERRGLNFRDVFDSSFDTILYLDYLSLDDSKRLLSQRVIGLPVPFLYLCHCISGGLARDLIRACRDLLEVADGPMAERSLSGLCRLLVQLDLKAKVRALTIAAKDIKLAPGIDQFLHHLQELVMSDISVDQLLKICQYLINESVEVLFSPLNEQDEIPSQQEKIDSLSLELSTYLAFVSTLLEFFSESLDEQMLREAEISNAIEEFARAQKALAINPRLARLIISEFRASQHMSAIWSDYKLTNTSGV